MCKLTEKQTEKFWKIVTEQINRGRIDDSYFNIDQRLLDKLEKFEMIKFIAANNTSGFWFNEDVGGFIAGTKLNAILSEKGMLLAKDIFGENLNNMVAQENYNKNICWKCQGKGRIREYGHVQGGICFECNGKGR